MSDRKGPTSEDEASDKDIVENPTFPTPTQGTPGGEVVTSPPPSMVTHPSTPTIPTTPSPVPGTPSTPSSSLDLCDATQFRDLYVYHYGERDNLSCECLSGTTVSCAFTTPEDCSLYPCRTGVWNCVDTECTGQAECKTYAGDGQSCSDCKFSMSCLLDFVLAMVSHHFFSFKYYYIPPFLSYNKLNQSQMRIVDMAVTACIVVPRELFNAAEPPHPVTNWIRHGVSSKRDALSVDPRLSKSVKRIRLVCVGIMCRKKHRMTFPLSLSPKAPIGRIPKE